ncbi:DUF4333 domain-containing protein [Streptomyces fractus]|uniref:DUF4333 domain-containing protein n=1 Tax=Streptomyces fractus TaxID=641806 RepID=UPI003CE6DEA0
MAALTAQVGKAPDAFACPEGLPAKVDAVIRCQLASEGKRYGVTVSAKSIVNGQVNMDFKVDDGAADVAVAIARDKDDSVVVFPAVPASARYSSRRS